METATVFTLASLKGLRAGSICAVYANKCKDEFKTGGSEESTIKVANEALDDLEQLRQTKKKKKEKVAISLTYVLNGAPISI